MILLILILLVKLLLLSLRILQCVKVKVRLLIESSRKLRHRIPMRHRLLLLVAGRLLGRLAARLGRRLGLAPMVLVPPPVLAVVVIVVVVVIVIMIITLLVIIVIVAAIHVIAAPAIVAMVIIIVIVIAVAAVAASLFAQRSRAVRGGGLRAPDRLECVRQQLRAQWARDPWRADGRQAQRVEVPERTVDLVALRRQHSFSRWTGIGMMCGIVARCIPR